MAAVTSPRFIGRRTERGLLERIIAASRAGIGQVVLLSGEAGVGKSRLLDELAQIARTKGHRVLVGGCISQHEGAAPLAPIAEALRELAFDTSDVELDKLIGPGRAALAGLVPGLSRSAREAGAGLMYTSTQERLNAHIVEVMSRLAREVPLVLIVEDIHWADDATLELLRLLARNLRDAPAVLIASFRSDETDPDRRLTAFIAELERLARPEHVALDRFSRGEVTEQVAAIRGTGSTSELLEDLFARSEGNPFYVEELLAAGDAAESLAPTLQAVLDARLSSLSENARRIVAAAAVRGAESTEDQLAVVTGLDEAPLARALHELIDRKIFERRRSGGREVVEFRHALLRSAAYQEQLPSERRHLHIACARMLEQDQATLHDPYRQAELARHWEASGEIARALPASISAGAAAEAAYQPAIAREQYERALRLIAALQDEGRTLSVDTIDLLERAARVAAGSGSARAIEHIIRAIELVDPSRDPVRAGLLYERLGRYRWYSADGQGSLEAYREANHLVPRKPLSAARARVTAGLAQLLMILARFDESARYAREALVNARAVGDKAIEAHVLDTQGVNAAYLGDMDQGLKLLRQARSIAEEAGDLEEVGRTYANQVDLLLTSARYEEAADLGREAFELLHDRGLLTNGFLLNYAAWALHLLARWPEAITVLQLSRQRPTYTNDEIMSLAVSTMIEACRGEFDAAHSHLDICAPLIATAIDTQLILPFAEAGAELALWTGKPMQALHRVRKGLERSEPLVGGNIKRYGPVYALGLRAVADIVEQATDAVEVATAKGYGATLISAMSTAHAEIKAHHPAHVRLAEPYLALCRAEQTRIDQTPDPLAWSTAADQVAGLGRRHAVAYARWRQAEALLRAKGSVDEARSALSEAHQIAADIGAEPLRQQIEALARRARIGLVGSARDQTVADAARFGLTARETEVLRLVAAGKTDREIGAELFISGKTASVHVSNLLAKMGVARRSEAAAIAVRIGLSGEQTAPAAGRQ